MKLRIFLSQTDYNGFCGYYCYSLPNELGWYLVSKNNLVSEFFDTMNELDDSFLYKILNKPFTERFSFGMNSVIFRSDLLTEEFCMYLVLKEFINPNQIIR